MRARSIKWSQFAHKRRKRKIDISHNAEISPIEKIAKTFRAISLYDTLTTTEPREIEHVLGKLLNTGLETDVTSVDDIDAVAHRVRYVFLHEASEPGQVGGDAWNAHDSALGRRVSPRLVIGRKNAQMAASDEFLVVEAEQRIGRRQKLGMKHHLRTQIARKANDIGWVLI